ncbi:MAG: sugar kinase [Pseudoalteromonas sp.]|uniref:sugar kinase n=1 Tax=unclassified Pseudoalteromonas TaxID=194690 RepID=UPI00110B6421|nr:MULTISPECIES: sugar kinase [unclassified Pseudoalteromonas]MCH2089728.1 sugar kinase [Pseudoalteromonas sp.]TMP17747.1 sugar kinase [Pseudoalteromonas sp. S2721]
MKKIFFLGECMVELKAISNSTLNQSFAGDVYNSAVYLKRCFSSLECGVVSAIGTDALSIKMRQRFVEEGLATQLVFTHANKVPGIYYIETDEQGERSFTYWRHDSAARKVVDFFNPSVEEELASADMLFISGISLAVIEPASRDLFWQIVQRIKKAGVKIVFDPNYRARLWQSEQETKGQYTIAFELADICLPGIEDLTTLYELHSAQAVMDYLAQFNISEVVVKNGPSSVFTKINGQLFEHQITPVTHVVDTTSAGDAFNGAYLGARMAGMDEHKAVQLAAKAAAVVIQQPGAITPKEHFVKAMQST